MLSLVFAAYSGVKSCCRNFCRVSNISFAYCFRSFNLLSLRLGCLRATIQNYVLEFWYRVFYLQYILLFTGASLVAENTGCCWYFVSRRCCCFAESWGRCFARKWPIMRFKIDIVNRISSLSIYFLRSRECSFDAGIILALLGHAWRCQEMLGEAIIGEFLLSLWT